MRIGVKYCGGCNPRYDRVALVHRLMEERPEDRFEAAVPGEVYDQLLVVCGCLSQCADLTGLTAHMICRIHQDDCLHQKTGE